VTTLAVVCQVPLGEIPGQVCGGELEIEWQVSRSTIGDGSEEYPWDYAYATEVISVKTFCFHCPTRQEAEELLINEALKREEAR
jgi:hypothetical protein